MFFKENSISMTILIVYAIWMLGSVEVMKVTNDNNTPPLLCNKTNQAIVMIDSHHCKIKNLDGFWSNLVNFTITAGAMAVITIKENNGQWWVPVTIWLFILGPLFGLFAENGRIFLAFLFITGAVGSWVMTGRYFDIYAMMISVLTLYCICFFAAGMIGISVVNSLKGFFGGIVK